MKTITTFLLGMWEFRRDLTWADPTRTIYTGYTDLDIAYDWGREWAHRLTLRYWDDQ